MALSLSRSSFLALAAVGWADGRIAKDEASALLRAAAASGIAGEDLAAIEQATKEKVELGDIDTSAITPWESALTFAIASWLARLDGVVKPDEQESLRNLGKKLGLTDKAMSGAAVAAFDVAMLQSGSRPEKYDFAALEARLREKLPTLAKGELAGGLQPVSKARSRGFLRAIELLILANVPRKRGEAGYNLDNRARS